MVYAYAGAGVKLPRSSGEQYKVGQKVLPSLALPGDLLFYGPEGTQSVALFIGNGQMVETTDTGRDRLAGSHQGHDAVPGAHHRLIVHAKMLHCNSFGSSTTPAHQKNPARRVDRKSQT